MLIGQCANSYTDSYDMLKEVKKAGADFIEVRGFTIEGYEIAKVKEIKDQLIELNMPALASNCIMPGTINFFDDHNTIQSYLHRLFERLAILGVKTQVVGSGKARNIPDGVSYDDHLNRFAEVMQKTFIPLCKEYDITLCIESLNKKETNFINTVKEGVELAKFINSPYVAAHIDSYHMGLENEPFESLENYKGICKHVHIAATNSSRAFPSLNDGIDWKHIIDCIKKSGCTDKLSLEATAKNAEPWAEIKEAIDLLRPLV